MTPFEYLKSVQSRIEKAHPELSSNQIEAISIVCVSTTVKSRLTPAESDLTDTIFYDILFGEI